MFAKRSFLGKGRDAASGTNRNRTDSTADVRDQNAPVPSYEDVSNDATHGQGDVECNPEDDNELKSFRRGIRDGSIHLNVKLGCRIPAKNNVISQGGHSGLSFTDDLDEDDKIVIRKGVTNIIIESEDPDTSAPMVEGEYSKSLHGGLPFARNYGNNRKPQQTHGAGGSGSMLKDIYMDVDGEGFASTSGGLTNDNFQSNIGDTAMGGAVRKETSNRQMLGVASADSDEEFEYYDTTEGDTSFNSDGLHQGTAKQYEYIALEPFLDRHLDDIRSEIELLRRNLESNRQMATYRLSTPEKYREVMKNIEENLSTYESLNNEARALGGLRSSKEYAVNKSFQVLYNNRKDISDCYYRMHRWFMCDILRSVGIESDYGCGYLEETDDNGVDVSQVVKTQFESRLCRVEELKEEQRNIAIRGVDDFLKNNVDFDISIFMTDTVTDCFTLQIPLDRLKEIYPSSFEPESVDMNIMNDVVDKYKTLSGAISTFEHFKHNCPEDYNQLRIEERLQPIYRFYVLNDLLTWDPLKHGADDSGNTLAGREWLICLKRFNTNRIGQLVLDLIVPACINAIESWDITCSSQSQLLSRLLADTIEHLPTDGRGAAIEKLSSVFLKVLESRVGVICLQGVGNLLKDSWVAGYLKFRVVQITKNVMRFNHIFTGNTLSKVVLDNLFMNHLLPMLDFQNLMDAFAVAQFFTFIGPISAQLCIKNKRNAIIKSTVYTIGERNWESRFEAGGLLDRLKLKMTNADYLHLIDAVFKVTTTSI